jgi:hypothetical protein
MAEGPRGSLHWGRRLGRVGYGYDGCIRRNECKYPAQAISTSDAFYFNSQYYNALEEWRSGNLIRKPFEIDKFVGTYAGIRGHITELLDDDQQTEQITDRFKSWVEERCAASLISSTVLVN